ncbi:EscU/YscU/HrcU family type III secretion system export apparatus switch protein [Citrobacter portucalensis]|uniref:EscU/YscU/HrcU family type III secretion system export apparatus switch protein n=1 Tax=Citrobacter portucalensis TaxID=1639133 RepID=UPI00226B8282|nr:EscU/YscU/HrcU family type III secretion system export apparatus switch protein [Citrobacter portucalensis]MCX8985954.1 EscU/YscU/HrcU family type III secretion system export apparatus switch protein [Citrobacter portucalensis]
MESSEPKKYPPTEKKLDDLKRKGQFPKTEFAEPTIELFGFAFVIVIALDYLFENANALLASMINAGISTDVNVFFTIMNWAVGLLLLFKIVATVLNWIFLNKAVISTEELGFKIEKINPKNGIKNIFGLEMLSRSLRNVIEIVFLLFLIKYVFDVCIEKELSRLDSINNVSFLLSTFLSYIFLTALLFVIYGVCVGMVDFMVERFHFHHKNRMTFTEMKNELKETEGSPEIKSERKKKMHEVMNRPMTEGRRPAFALANPTHILVPICYDPKIDILPVVLRIYTDLMAQEERKRLLSMDIPIIENKILARAFFRKMKTGEDFIPTAFYRDVALIIAALKKYNRFHSG